MNEWKEVRLGEFVKVQGGYAFKSKDFKSNGIPIVKIKNLINNKIDLTEADYVDEKFLEIANNYIINNGDVLISLTGSNVNQSNSMVGKVAYVNKNTPICLLNQRVGRLILKKNNIDLKYIFYFLSQKEVQYYLASNASGSANQANINSSTIENLKIPYKDYITTKKIADILSVIDEKIETLQNINEILEELAKSIFKSWFVDFDIVKAKSYGKSDSEIAKEFGISKEIVKLFPSEFVESEIGKIPKGWEIGNFEKDCNIVYGKNLPKSKLKEKGYPVFGGNGVIGYYDNFLYKMPQITIACRGAASGKINITLPYSFITNNSLIIEIKNKKLTFEYMKELSFITDFNNYVTGSAQPQITIANIKQHKFLIPPKKIIDYFTKITSNFNNIYFNNLLQIHTLQNLRDTLLPKLINGEIEVDELNIKGIENEFY